MNAGSTALRPIRSFVRREGRMTVGQQLALDTLLPRLGLDPTRALDPVAVFGRRAPLTFEIGFGVGDYLLARLLAEPERDFIGAEVHRPGVGHLLSRAEAGGAGNLRVYTTDAVEVLRARMTDATQRLEMQARREVHAEFYRATTAYGHFGREDQDFPWERTDRAEALAAIAR